MGSDGFCILEYIRSSIEIIMNLKIEDLEKDAKSSASEAPSGRSEISGNVDLRQLKDSIRRSGQQRKQGRESGENPP